VIIYKEEVVTHKKQNDPSQFRLNREHIALKNIVLPCKEKGCDSYFLSLADAIQRKQIDLYFSCSAWKSGEGNEDVSNSPIFSASAIQRRIKNAPVVQTPDS
jgi:hypothetical protein